ncbi:peptidyl-prolyl cis-trans isomerase chloroplastic [Micractinium conductrix]|uniref:peptidylprolyl isomerase n=1 Tax=Micractinium conductrix TaxID=554055 RepID=A0A2P6V1R8_9CHLO|nr:peptidyl-prolyl cis-trans isomerase chloroplastic [Micractinium conductrix]|eukprot:PSC68033.1 peptidyl-prolyl cis-trans isomerase chloroplastic [Micractinium conductrix]
MIAASASQARPQAAVAQAPPQPRAIPPLLRRVQQAALAGAAAAVLAAGVAAPLPALARSTALDLPSCTKLQLAPAGIAFCDVRVGRGEAPALGDQIEVDYTARAAATGKVYDGSRGFEFTLGEGEVVPGWELAVLGGQGVPAVKEGGIRSVTIPPELAYGQDGYSCLYGLSTSCRVPPGSAVEITFEYKGLGY